MPTPALVPAAAVEGDEAADPPAEDAFPPEGSPGRRYKSLLRARMKPDEFAMTWGLATLILSAFVVRRPRGC
jgi:hypothetical protein